MRTHGPLALALASALTACTLLVSTSELTGGSSSGGGGDATIDTGISSSDGGAEGSLDDEGGTNPCVGNFVVCETFGSPTAIDGYPKNTDGTSSIVSDTQQFRSPPRSAKFVIAPSTANMSPDATLTIATDPALGHFVVTAGIRVESKEPDGRGRLLRVGAGGTGTLTLMSTGALVNNVALPNYPSLPEVPIGRWVRIRVEIDVETVQRANVTVDDVSTGMFELGGSWGKGRVFVVLGVSEANSPMTGWTVHWDDVVIRQL